MTAQMAVLLKALGLGMVAGMRSMTAPAMLSRVMSKTPDAIPVDTPFGKLCSPEAATALTVMAAGEMVVDKLPNTPNRTLPPSVAFRMLSGALVGSALMASRKQSRAAGAVAGALGALAATYGMFHLRREVSRRVKLPDPAVGLMEDALAVGLKKTLLGDSPQLK
jgi:uncharacterized membrane protein